MNLDLGNWHFTEQTPFFIGNKKTFLQSFSSPTNDIVLNV